MKEDDLYELELGTKLTISGEEGTFVVSQISNYENDAGDEWTNLTEFNDGGQRVIEVSDKITRWDQVLDLPGVTTDEKTVDYRGHHFVQVEHNTEATVEIQNKEGTTSEDSFTSVYKAKDNKKILLAIEKVGENMFVWYSEKKLSAEQINVAG